MGSQLLAESLDRDSRFEAVAVAATAATTDILSAVSARKPDIAVISATGGCQLNTPAVCPSTTGVVGPHIPRKKR